MTPKERPNDPIFFLSDRFAFIALYLAPGEQAQQELCYLVKVQHNINNLLEREVVEK